MVVRNPCSSTRTSYCPAGNDGALKRPSAFDVRVRTKPVDLLVITTAALGTTAPESSVTAPEMVPVGVWAYTATLIARTRTNNINADVTLDITLACLPDQN